MTLPIRIHRAGPLTAMPHALDVDVMSTLLAPFLGDGSNVRVSAAHRIASSWEKRAVVAYETTGPNGAGPVLIGKVYTDRDRAEQVHRVLEELHARYNGGVPCAVPRPVACLPDLGMSVYVAATGRSLDGLEGPERVEGITATAAWLACVHASSLPLCRQFDLAAEARDLAIWSQLVTRLEPRAAPGAARLMERLVGLADRLHELSLVPIHRDFHYQHTLYEEGRVVVIDLDEMRFGDPALDVAHFIANLRLLAYREGERGDAGPEASFLEAYAAASGYEPDLRHEFFHAYTCLKIAKQLIGGRGPRPAPAGGALWQELDFILGEGLRCLPQ